MTNARYDLLEDIIAAEKALAFFPFIEPEAEVRTWMSNLERDVQIEP